MATTSSDDHKQQRVIRISDIVQEPLAMLTPIGGYENMPLVPLEIAIEPLTPILPGIKTHASTAKQQCQNPPADGLSIDESASIILYTMGWKPLEQCLSFVLNRVLRSIDRNELKPWFLYLKLFFTALERLPSVQQTIYRGAKLDLHENYSNGKSIIWWGFSSCTISNNALRAEVFLSTTISRTVFSIECKSGKNIQKHSFYPSEPEIILLAATQFKVLTCSNHGQGLHVVHLQETTSSIPLRQSALAPSPNKLPGVNIASIQHKNTYDSNTATNQNNVLIWLDSNINELGDTDNTIVTLRSVFKTMVIFTDPDQCLQYLTNEHNKRIFLIVSGALGQQLVPIIHNMSQIISIFVFCGNKARHQQWAKNWSKIKGVFIEVDSLCEVIQYFVDQNDQQSMFNSSNSISGTIINQHLNQLEASFIYTRILKESLLQILFDDQHIKNFLTYCRVQFIDDDEKLKNCDRLEREYHKHTPIWWYTYESFLYQMLNKALKLMEINIIVKMGFFIQDLHRQIEQLHSKQFNGDNNHNKFTVYRGQRLPNADLDRLMKAKGGLVSFNTFLSTTMAQDISLHYAKGINENNPDLIGVLFVMTIDPSISSIPFASISDVSFSKDSYGEVLFSMHSVFRIEEIKQIDNNNHLWQVDLTFTSDTDPELEVLGERIREEIEGPTEWHRLGNILLILGQFNMTEEIYNVLLSQTNNSREKAILYNQLGSAKMGNGEYAEAKTFYEKVLEIYQQLLSPDHPDHADPYNNIGLVYYHMGEYTQALSSHEKALEIRRKTRPATHPDLAESYNNIALVYEKMGEHSKALSLHEQALEIRQKTFISNHPCLAQSYNNIGLVYDSMKEYPKALSSHKNALEIRQKILPPNHPDLAESYYNIGSVYENMGTQSKAFTFYEQAVKIGQNILPENHPNLKKWITKFETIQKNFK